MKINAKVIGHELVKKGDQNLVKIKLKGTGFEPLKIVDFNVQQSLPLER